MVNVPPLLCSTPPPIDFGEEDDDSGLQSTLNLEDGDEFSEYGLVTETHDSTKIPVSRLTPDLELPKTDSETPPPIADNCYMSRISPPPFANRPADEKPKNITPVEAYNFDVAVGNEDLKRTSTDIEDFGDFQHIENKLPDDNVKCVDDHVYYEDEEATNNDNVPSLKLDSLSLYSSASISSTTLSPAMPLDEVEHEENEAETRQEPTGKLHTKLCDTNQVTLEDISDDSSDEYSPKKRKSLIINENDNDFFTIQIVDKKDQENNVFKSDKIEQSFSREHESQHESVVVTSQSDPEISAANDDEEQAFNNFVSGPNLISNSPPDDYNDCNDDFGDFADFTATFPDDTAPSSIIAADKPSTLDTTHSTIDKLQSNGDDLINDDDDFDDFQDFANANNVPPKPSQTVTQQATTTMVPSVPTDPVKVDKFEVDEDDDFGDFSDASFATPQLSDSRPVETKVPPPPPPAATNVSISERVKPVLEMMFPAIGQTEISFLKSQTESIQKPKHCTAIEQAKALDYQWASSEMRHALIRSLGIDSRNILFGEKWNPNMPRFAANLSFDPLKPIKTQKNETPSISNPVSHTPAQAVDDFDWKSGVSPIGGADTSQPETSKIEAIHKPQSGESNATDDGQVEPEKTNVTLDDIASCIEPSNVNSADAVNEFDASTKATANFTTGTAEALSATLSADSDGNSFDNFEQQHMQQHIDLKHQATKAISNTTSSADLTTAASSNLCNNNIGNTLISGMPAAEQYMGVTVTTTTYAVPLKETHIYTPSKSDTAVAKTTTPPIDFDYEIASAGIIIDETVVKKEYRDVEYHPPYGLELETNKLNAFDVPNAIPIPATVYLDPPKQQDVDDDFSDFQSVPAQKPQSLEKAGNSGVATFGDQMILSPAILLPQAIALAKPTIEWGESANTNINPDELARIEELFSQPKVASAQSSPAHQQQTKQKPHTQTISATVSKNQTEDDDWSDFVSVPIATQQQPQQQQKLQPTLGLINNNNNNNYKSRGNNKLGAFNSPQKFQTSKLAARSTKSNVCNTADADEWSDFVSSTAVPQTAAPQFNSGAWQRANFYNNPLSLYQQNQTHAHSNLVPNTAETVTKYQQQQNHQQNFSNNNNNVNNFRNRGNNQSLQQQQQPQQIHIMHDFSTAPVDSAATRSSQLYQQQHHHHTQHLQHQHHHHHQQQQQQQQHQTSQFQIGNAKVAPRISLIPDLSFMAPALPANAGAFMSSLPKPSFSAKK